MATIRIWRRVWWRWSCTVDTTHPIRHVLSGRFTGPIVTRLELSLGRRPHGHSLGWVRSHALQTGLLIHHILGIASHGLGPAGRRRTTEDVVKSRISWRMWRLLAIRRVPRAIVSVLGAIICHAQ